MTRSHGIAHSSGMRLAYVPGKFGGYLQILIHLLCYLMVENVQWAFWPRYIKDIVPRLT